MLDNMAINRRVAVCADCWWLPWGQLQFGGQSKSALDMRLRMLGLFFILVCAGVPLLLITLTVNPF